MTVKVEALEGNMAELGRTVSSTRALRKRRERRRRGEEEGGGRRGGRGGGRREEGENEREGRGQYTCTVAVKKRFKNYSPFTV